MISATPFLIVCFLPLFEFLEMNPLSVVHRYKRHCTSYGCGRSVCQECPSCCGNPSFKPVFNINFNCCSAPRPSPSCCPQAPPAPVPALPPSPCCGPSPSPMPNSCCLAPVPAPCCPPSPPTSASPLACCKNAPIPENPCCQAIAEVITPVSASPACCAAAPVRANPCCQPAPKPALCSCSAPRPVPCRCGALPMTSDCPNCDLPSVRCSPMSPIDCSMRRMRRDVHQQILTHVFANH